MSLFKKIAPILLLLILCSCTVSKVKNTEAEIDSASQENSIEEDNTTNEPVAHEAVQNEKAENSSEENNVLNNKVVSADPNRNTPQYEGYLDDYKNPYRIEGDLDNVEGHSLYWELQRDGAEAARIVAKELKEKNWENIQADQGFPNKYRDMAIYLTQEERKKFLYTVSATMSDNMVIVLIGVTEENRTGEICSVFYAGRHDPREYGDKEIYDAFDPKIWSLQYAY